jgi:hypothetical protein
MIIPGYISTFIVLTTALLTECPNFFFLRKNTLNNVKIIINFLLRIDKII